MRLKKIFSHIRNVFKIRVNYGNIDFLSIFIAALLFCDVHTQAIASTVISGAKVRNDTTTAIDQFDAASFTQSGTPTTDGHQSWTWSQKLEASFTVLTTLGAVIYGGRKVCSLYYEGFPRRDTSLSMSQHSSCDKISSHTLTVSNTESDESFVSYKNNENKNFTVEESFSKILASSRQGNEKAIARQADITEVIDEIRHHNKSTLKESQVLNIVHPRHEEPKNEGTLIEPEKILYHSYQASSLMSQNLDASSILNNKDRSIIFKCVDEDQVSVVEEVFFEKDEHQQPKDLLKSYQQELEQAGSLNGSFLARISSDQELQKLLEKAHQILGESVSSEDERSMFKPQLVPALGPKMKQTLLNFLLDDHIRQHENYWEWQQRKLLYYVISNHDQLTLEDLKILNSTFPDREGPTDEELCMEIAEKVERLWEANKQDLAKENHSFSLGEAVSVEKVKAILEPVHQVLSKSILSENKTNDTSSIYHDDEDGNDSYEFIGFSMSEDGGKKEN